MNSNQYKKTGKNLKVSRDSLIQHVIEQLEAYDSVPDWKKADIIDPYSNRLIVKLKGSNRRIEVPTDIQQEAIQIWTSSGRFDQEHPSYPNTDPSPAQQFAESGGDLPRDFEIFNKRQGPLLMDREDWNGQPPLNQGKNIMPNDLNDYENPMNTNDIKFMGRSYARDQNELRSRSNSREPKAMNTDAADELDEEYANIHVNHSPSKFMEHFNQNSVIEKYGSDCQRCKRKEYMDGDSGTVEPVYEVDSGDAGTSAHIADNSNHSDHTDDHEDHGDHGDHADMDDNDDAGSTDKMESFYLSPLNVVLLIIILIGLIAFVKFNNVKYR